MTQNLLTSIKIFTDIINHNIDLQYYLQVIDLIKESNNLQLIELVNCRLQEVSGFEDFIVKLD